MKIKQTLPRSSFLSCVSGVVVRLGAAGLLGWAGQATAQSLKAPAAVGKSPWYAGFDLGVAGVNDRSGETATQYALLAGGTATADQNRSKAAWRLYGGYRFNEQVGFELGYLHSDDFKYSIRGTKSSGTAYSGSETYSFSGFDYSLVLRPTVASGYNNLFFKWGIHHLTRKLDMSVPGVLTGSENLSGSGQLLGVGYEYPNLSPGVDLRLGFTHYDRVGSESGTRASLYSLGVVKRY